MLIWTTRICRQRLNNILVAKCNYSERSRLLSQLNSNGKYSEKFSREIVVPYIPSTIPKAPLQFLSFVFSQSLLNFFKSKARILIRKIMFLWQFGRAGFQQDAILKHFLDQYRLLTSSLAIQDFKTLKTNVLTFEYFSKLQSECYRRNLSDPRIRPILQWKLLEHPKPKLKIVNIEILGVGSSQFLQFSVKITSTQSLAEILLPDGDARRQLGSEKALDILSKMKDGLDPYTRVGPPTQITEYYCFEGKLTDKMPEEYRIAGKLQPSPTEPI